MNLRPVLQCSGCRGFEPGERRGGQKGDCQVGGNEWLGPCSNAWAAARASESQRELRSLVGQPGRRCGLRVGFRGQAGLPHWKKQSSHLPLFHWGNGAKGTHRRRWPELRQLSVAGPLEPLGWKWTLTNGILAEPSGASFLHATVTASSVDKGKRRRLLEVFERFCWDAFELFQSLVIAKDRTWHDKTRYGDIAQGQRLAAPCHDPRGLTGYRHSTDSIHPLQRAKGDVGQQIPADDALIKHNGIVTPISKDTPLPRTVPSGHRFHTAPQCFDGVGAKRQSLCNRQMSTTEACHMDVGPLARRRSETAFQHKRL